MKNYLKISLFCFLTTSLSYGQVEVKYLNERFVWIKVPSKFVKARLNYPVEGYSVCWVEAKTPKENFDFVFRRGLSYESCLSYVLEIRKLLKRNSNVEIIGFPGSKKEDGVYSSLWELIRGETGCVGYFGECENFEKDVPEWHDWKSKPIDPTLYP